MAGVIAYSYRSKMDSDPALSPGQLLEMEQLA